jgi:molecular chaperone GrpE
VGDKAIPGEETPVDLTVPELNPPDPDSGEALGSTAGEPAGEAIEVIDIPQIDLPEDPEEAIAVLLSALGDSRAEAAGYLEGLQRVAAEFDNFRKRAIRERNEIVERASQRLIERLLPTLDGLDAALVYQPQTEAEENLLSGMKDIQRLLLEALAADGFEAIEASGVAFDPAVHEAVTGPGDDGDGELTVQEMRRGYMLRGRVVRAALVAVEHA